MNNKICYLISANPLHIVLAIALIQEFHSRLEKNPRELTPPWNSLRSMQLGIDENYILKEA